MKDYLNAEEKRDMTFLYCLIGQVEDMIERWDKHGNLEKEEKKYFKTSLTLCDKAAKLILSRMNKQQTLRLIKDINATEIFCLPKVQAEIQKKKQELIESKELVGLTPDALKTIVQKALYWCDPSLCLPKDCNQKDCELKGILMELDIDPAHNTKGYCPYNQGVK